MYPYHWTWSYTLYIVVPLLVAFLIVGVVLLVRRSLSPPSQEQHHSPPSVSTHAYGALGYRQVNTEVNPNEGYRRAAHTQYYPRIER